MNENENKVFNKTVINCLPCIYTVHHLNLYKMGVIKNCDLAYFNKKEVKNVKNRVKNANF